MGGEENEIPEVFQKQFLYSVDNDAEVILEGKMDKVWHRPVWLRPLFWLLAWLDILFPETGKNINCKMTIIGGRGEDGRVYQKWNRTFHFDRKRYFNAVMTYSDNHKAVTERFGTVKFIVVLWGIEFISPTTIKIITKGNYLTLGRYWIRLPFAPIVSVTETAINKNTLHICLEISVLILGAIFGYEGTFNLRVDK